MTHAARPDHRVLVVEDELMIAMLFESILDASSKCTVIGPFARVKLALEAARNEPLDAALLDIHRPLLQKPFRPQAVLATLAMMIALPIHRK